jgi:hypothetical protein
VLDGADDTIPVGRVNTLTLDALGAGEGHVICKVTNSSGHAIDVEITEDDNGRVLVKYIPTAPDTYHVVVGFGGQLIPGGDFTQQARIFYCLQTAINLLIIQFHHVFVG